MKKLTTLVVLAMLALMALSTGVLLASHTSPDTLVVNDDATGNVKEPAPCDRPPTSNGGLHTTIGAAVAHAGTGDLILVCPGTYRENVVINVVDLTLQGISGSGQLVINAKFGGTTGTGIKITSNGVTVDNLKITGAGPCSEKPGIDVLSSNNIITHNTFANNSCCAILLHKEGNDGNVVKFNHIKSSGSSGIRIQGDTGSSTTTGSDDNIIALNTMINGNGGLEIRGNSAKNTIRWNTAEDNAEDGFKVKAGATGANLFTGNKSDKNKEFGYKDATGLNTYFSNKCRKNHASGSSPTGKCGPQP